jgi:hypothetical protein
MKSETPEYVSWSSMMTRCYNQAHVAYATYGGAEILVCDRWHSFDAFLADMGPRPSAKHSLDRIDNGRGYEPGNCRWATVKEQQNNRRNNVFIEFRGERKTAAQWAEQFGYHRNLILARLKAGLSGEELFKAPNRARRIDCHWVNWEGERLTAAELAQRVGIPPDRLRSRLARGWSLQDAVIPPMKRGEVRSRAA